MKFLDKSVLIFCVFVGVASFEMFADAKIFGRRNQSSNNSACADGQCEPQQTYVTETIVEEGYSEGSAGGNGSAAPRRKLFGRRNQSNGGSAGEARSYSGGSAGDSRRYSNGGSAGDSRRVSNGGSAGDTRRFSSNPVACEAKCTCPNCGTTFDCVCDGVRMMAKTGCHCCDKCTGLPGCGCGCADCTCNKSGKRGGDELDPTRPDGMKKVSPPAEK